MSNNVRFISPSRFVLDGPDVYKWRQDMGRWVEGAEFSTKYRRGHWDGMVRPGSIAKGGHFTLGRGLLERVIHDLHATIVVPPPATPLISLDDQTFSKLRDFQREALDKIFTRKWGCVALATNAGKGAIIALAAKTIAYQVGTVLICCDEVSVFQALEEEIRKWANLYPETVTAGRRDPPNGPSPIVLAMIPTLHRRVGQPEWDEWFESIQAVFLDEADKSTADSWQRVLRRLVNTHWRIGTSGTFPTEETPAELTLSEHIGPILISIKNIDLIERGISARPTVELCSYEQSIPRPREWNTYSGVEKRMYIYTQGIVLNTDRHGFITSLLEPSVPNAIIVNYLQHGRELSQLIPDSWFLSGDDSPEVRNAVLERFKNGEIKTLIVSKILDRGTNDLGHAVGLIFASAQGSDRQTLQRIGRGLRRTDGKKFLFLKDIIDRGHKYLETASRHRVELYNAEGFEVKIREESVWDGNEATL